MKRSIYAVACLMMVLLAGFTACGDDDDAYSCQCCARIRSNIAE